MVMKMSNSSLISCTILSKNRTLRTAKIDTITIHHAAAVKVSAEAIGNEFAKTSRQASSNYGIGYNGEIGLYVPENYRAWTSSNRSNDNRAITIEVANSTGAPNWEISDASYQSLIKLCVDICQRNDIKKLLWRADKSLIGQIDKQNMTVHQWFANTSCPGPYLFAHMGDIADKVNNILEDSGMDINKFLDKITPEQAYKLITKANQYISTLPPDQYAKEACEKGVKSKIFSDGNSDGLVDSPQAFLKRQELVTVLNRMGLLK